VRVSKEIPHRSHGEAVNRRRILAETRQRAVFNVDQRIIERSQAGRRLTEIDQILSPDDKTLSIMNIQEREQTRTGLEIEHIWLQLKLDIITQAEKERLLADKFDELEKHKPSLYRWLTENEHGLSMAKQIRNKVMPPIRVTGYYTKR